MTPLRSALQKEISDNVEYGEAILTMLKRKAERQLEIIAPAQDGRLIEVLRVLLDMQYVEVTLIYERYPLYTLKA